MDAVEQVVLRDHSVIDVYASDHARYWIDDLNPFIIEFGHGIGLRWYGVAYLTGLVWGYWMLVRWWRRGRSPISPDHIGDFVFLAGLGMVIGGRVVYCLVYGTDQLMHNPFGGWFLYDYSLHRYLDPGEYPMPGHTVAKAFTLPYVVKVWEGGMASHGGIAGLVAGAWLFGRRKGLHFLVLGDLLAATGTFGIAMGRLANFVNGELWGRPASGVPWAMIFPHAPPNAFGCEIPRHPSQLYAVFLEGFFVLAIVLFIHARHRRPGLSAGFMLALYAIGRFTGEFFREPDIGQPGSPGHDLILGFMTRGQELTLPVFAIGVFLIWWALSRPARPEAYAPPAEPPQVGSIPA
jgi:phosphatidylglycerol:prolipoprotein diacylglycerol transferase